MPSEQNGWWTRQRVLGVALFSIALLTTIALFEVLGTVFLAMTIAYILMPARRWLRRRSVGPLPATLLVTMGAVAGVLAILVPLLLLLFVRIEGAITLLSALPETVETTVGSFTVEFDLLDVRPPVEAYLQSTALAISAAIPVFLLKFTLFAFVVFALVHNERNISQQVMGIVPPEHRDIAEALHIRARDTLSAIYLLQGATALATTLIAMPVFLFFGYETWFSLSVMAGVLQFVPIIGPSVLVLALVIAELLAGELLRAVLMLVIGGAVIAAVPDVVIRPRIARRTTKLSSVLYFIGFVGGLLSLGAIGIIVGPLLVALLVEAATLVADGFSEEPSAAPADPDTTG